MTTLLALLGVALAAPLSGVVRERGTADPVPGALVVSGEARAETGPGGRFVLDLPEGTHTLQVTGPAHAPAAVSVEVPAARAVTVFLEPAAPPPEIVVEAQVDSPHASRQVLDRERVEKTPGTHDDPLRLLQALPGVAMTPEYSPSGGAIALRGAAPAESRVLLDGVELPYLYHFQQYASVVHTRLLDEVAIYPSAFAASYGDATGGVVAVRSREPDPARLHGGVSVNSIMGGAWVQAPASDATSVSASARRSYADLGDSSNDQYTAWPVFWDYLGRVDLRGGPEARYALTALGAGDRYGRYASDTALLDPLEAAEAAAFGYDRSFHGVLLTARHTTAAAEHESVVGLTAEAWRGDLRVARSARDEQALTGRHVTTWLPSEAWRLRLGGDARASRTTFLAETDRAWPTLGVEAPLLARGVPVDAASGRVLGGVFGEARATAGPLSVQPGLRLSGDSLVAAGAVEPRLTVEVAPVDDVTIRAAGGRYTQAPEPEHLDPTIGDPSLGLSRAWHAAAGADWAIAGRWELGVEGWGRSLQAGVYAPPGEAPRAVDGRAAGVELTSRYRLRDRFFAWVAATLGHTELGGVPGDFDQPYALSAVASWDFRPGWNAGVRWRYAAGLPITPLVDGIYDGDTDSYLPVPGATNSARLPDYQKLDVHFARDVAFRRWTLVLYAEAWYVPKGNNTLYRVYSYDYRDAADVLGPAFLPLLGARAEL